MSKMYKAFSKPDGGGVALPELKILVTRLGSVGQATF